ncbi:MAG: penicillin acylase family protein, partial [Pseudomonadota bacterium]
TAKYTGIAPPEPGEAFRQAVAFLMEHHGRIDPEWGEVNRLVRGDLSLPIGGASDTLRAIYPAEIGDRGILVAAAGDTWIGLAEWGEDGEVRADVIHQFGSAVLDAASPHYADQARLFAEEGWREALLDKADIEANASRRYRPGSAYTATRQSEN